MEIFTDESSFSRNAREQDEGRDAGGNWLLWLAAIAVLVGLNFASWSFCILVFGNPEHPMSYRLLTRLERLDPIEGFTEVTAPRGQFFSAKDLYARVYPFDRTRLRAYNRILKRQFIWNYKERDDVTFLSGDFIVVFARRLEEGDIFPRGMAVRARATTFPDAFVDFVLPSEEDPPLLFPVGETITIEESSTCAAVIHVDRDADEVMTFTAVPLVERSLPIAREQSIALRLPPELDLDASLPVIGAFIAENPLPPAVYPEGQGSGDTSEEPAGSGGDS